MICKVSISISLFFFINSVCYHKMTHGKNKLIMKSHGIDLITGALKAVIRSLT